jgi:hypothetical protein
MLTSPLASMRSPPNLKSTSQLFETGFGMMPLREVLS